MTRSVTVSSLMAAAALLLCASACSPDLGQAPFRCNAGEPKCPDGYSCNSADICVLAGSCPEGMLGCVTCGDGSCDLLAGEDCKTCPEDCPCVELCGNNTCDPKEDATNCPEDCPKDPKEPSCGDGSCDPDEDSATCPEDCPSSTPACTQDDLRCKGADAIERCDQGAWSAQSCTDLCDQQGKDSDGCSFSSADGHDVCVCVAREALSFGAFCSGPTDCESGMECMDMQGIVSYGAYCTKACTKDSDCPDLGGSTGSVCDPYSRLCMLDCSGYNVCPSHMSCSYVLYDSKCVPWL